MKISSGHLICLCVAVVIANACSTWQPREPVYDGKRLSTWMRELDKLWRDDLPAGEAKARLAVWTNVVRATGTDGLPFYSKWAGDTSHPTHQYASLKAIQILGPIAEPAIPALAKLLKNDRTASQAAYCVEAIGPAVIPALTNALTSTKNRGRAAAFSVLREFGRTAKPAAPALLHVIRTDPYLAFDALQTLVEVETNTDNLIPLLVKRLANTNDTLRAAFTLGRLGKPGIPTLLHSLTNESRNVRAAAEGALAPGFQVHSLDKQNASKPRFRILQSSYNLEVLGAASSSYAQGDFLVAAQTAARFTNHTDVVIRSAAMDAFYHLKPRAETNVPQATIDQAKDSWRQD